MHTICNQEQLTMIDMEPSLTFHYFIDHCQPDHPFNNSK